MKKFIFMVWTVVLITGCASVGHKAPSAPDVSLIETFPVFTVGSDLPDEEHYIIHFPKNHEFPVTLTLRGDLFDKEHQAESIVKITRDLYIYRQWGSYDKKHWLQINELFGGMISTGTNIQGGHVMLVLDTKMSSD